MRAFQLTVPGTTYANQGVRAAVLLLVCGTLFGCSSIRNKIAERREACDSLCQQARNAKRDGWPDQADLLLNEAVRQRPGDLETRRQLAEALWDCGRQQDAIDEYRELIGSHPRDARLQQRMAVMLWTTGQRTDAARFAEQTLRLDPTSAEALLVKARSEIERRDFDAAVATYIRLTRAAPDLVEAKLELAQAHVERGHAHQACALLRDVVAQPQLSDVQRADAEWKLGMAYASEDRWCEAASHLANSIEKRTDITGGDWQLLTVAKSLSGQDTTGVQTKAVQASERQHSDADVSTWSALRDRLIARGELMATASAPRDSVIRADFSRNMQAELSGVGPAGQLR